jgi:hypothetical protein
MRKKLKKYSKLLGLLKWIINENTFFLFLQIYGFCIMFSTSDTSILWDYNKKKFI